MKMNFKKWLVAIILLPIVAIGTCTYKAISSFDFLAETSSLTDLKENLSRKEDQIKELKRYYNSIVPSEKEVFIEFGKGGEIDIFRIYNTDSSEVLQSESYAHNSVLEKTMLDTLGWNEKTLETLRLKLKEANCISITNGEPANIGFKRSGMGKYFYNIFDKPIPSDKIHSYNDSCRYIYQSPTIVFEYGGGAIGPQCFPDKRRNNK